MTIWSRVCVFWSVVVVPLSLGAAPAQRHKSALPLVVDYAPAPSTLKDFIAQSDLVAVVTLGIPTYTENGHKPTTHFKANVLEVIKSSGAGPAGPVINVYRYGGKVNGPQDVVDVDELHFARWRSGMKLLLLLDWNKQLGEYDPLFGPDGAYELGAISGRIRAFGRGKIASAWQDRPTAAMLDEVRRTARK